MKIRRLFASLLAVALVAVFGVPVAKADPQPRMDIALADLQAARAKLEHAEHDKGGHRERALQLVDAAIAQIREGIRYDNRH